MKFDPKIFRPLFWKQLLHFKIFIGVHTLPRLFIRLWQLRQIKNIIGTAYVYVPFYREQWDSVDIHPKEIKNFADFHRIPVTNKQMFRQRQISDCMVTGLPEKFYYWKHTSGSSGDPFNFPVNNSLYFLRNFYLLSYVDIYPNRFLYWLGISFKKAMEYKVAELRVNNRPRGKEYLHLPLSYFRDDPGKFVQDIRLFKPDILDARSTTLVELARIFNRIPVKERPHIKYLVTHGEQLTPIQRQFIDNIFGTKVYNRYGLEETGDVGMECSLHQGLHIHEESLFVEILNEKDSPLPEGEYGRIIVTNFFSFVMPFIRYDTGDSGMILPGKCPCGVSARRLLVAGRRQAQFFDLGKKKFNTGEFEVIIGNFPSLILRCQIAKTGPESLEIRIIPAAGYSPSDLRLLEFEVNHKLGIYPIVKIVEQIPFSSSGKTKFFIDETKPVST